MKNGALATIAKTVFLIATTAYFFSAVVDRQGYGFFDNVDLAIHEAGHVIFSFGGEFVTVAGGTILQLLLPLVFVLYFWLRREIYSAAIVSLWLGQSFTNVARYAGDAQKMELPLLGGGNHDWNYLLLNTGLILKTEAVSEFFYLTGVAILVAGMAAGAVAVINDFNETKKENL
ncbi:MAG: hypothetical protein MUD10_02550 [Candidatus Pacebacteria bacterium]|jgi:hypothetical protein|nr:hypothetical protein [Candidatus Paceibacterota bacterium]